MNCPKCKIDMDKLGGAIVFVGGYSTVGHWQCPKCNFGWYGLAKDSGEVTVFSLADRRIYKETARERAERQTGIKIINEKENKK